MGSGLACIGRFCHGYGGVGGHANGEEERCVLERFVEGGW